MRYGIAYLALISFLTGARDGACEERWEYLGDVTATAVRPAGRLSVNLDSLRKRSGQFEIWQKIEFLPGRARRDAIGGDGGATMHLTLWALWVGRPLWQQ